MSGIRESSLTWRRDGDRFELLGRIDEHADLIGLAREIPGSGATLDLGGIRRFNSVGVREWVDFMRSTLDRPLVLARCSFPVVEQLNAIANFRGHATIESVLVPFECVPCGSSTSTELDVDRTFPDRVVVPIPTPSCETCGAAMSVEDDPDLYFRFIRILPPVAAPRSPSR